MQKLRVGIIGAGMAFEKLHYPAYWKLRDKFEITSICDTNREKAFGWAKTLKIPEENVFTNYMDMLNKDYIDVFDIMVPIELNFETAENIVKEKKPMICEKPLAPTKKQAEEFRKLPQKYNTHILIAENYRYNDEINIIKNIINEQKIGETIYFMQNRVLNFPKDMLGNKFPAVEWRQFPKYPGGAILDTGVHDIAALHHIFGSIDKIHAFARKQKEEFSPYSVVNVNMLFTSGLTGQFTFFCSGKEMQMPYIGLRIFGTKGEIFLEKRDCGTINIAYNDGNSEQIPYKPQQGYYHQLVNFYNGVTGKEKFSVTPEIEFGDTEIIFDIIESARTGLVVGGDTSTENKKIKKGENAFEKGTLLDETAYDDNKSSIPPVH
jgi:predicted dehydrogenase